MSSGPGLSDAIPNRYAGPQVNLVPIQVFPREPLSTDKKYPIGQVVILGKDPSSGTQGDLWYLANLQPVLQIGAFFRLLEDLLQIYVTKSTHLLHQPMMVT